MPSSKTGKSCVAIPSSSIGRDLSKSGLWGSLSREKHEDDSHDVQREIAIREYQVKDENRSIRWGKEIIKDREGLNQEINYPSYIFHSDLWQFEDLRDNKTNLQCDILKHTVLDMVANNINVVMLENELEPFFVVEGFGLLPLWLITRFAPEHFVLYVL